jgi:hypothetical protein
VKKGLLACPLVLRKRIRAQPQRHMGRLHRLPYHPYKLVVQRFKIGLVSQPDREGFDGLYGIVPPFYRSAYLRKPGFDASVG